MYAYFIGKITYIFNDHVIIESSNIGYNIYMPSSHISDLQLGQETKIYTYTSVREDAFVLYGFLSMAELDFFKLLLTVNGVGPKAAMSILGVSSIDALTVAIISQDVKALSKVPGIGSKTAGRIILDLKDKVSGDNILESISVAGNNTSNSGVKGEACLALTALGYNNSEAMKVINSIDITDNMNVEDIVRMALINL